MKFTLKKGDKALLVSLAGLTILPKKYWETHKLSEPLTEVPLGSGAYTLKDYKMGQYLVYERLKNYWGMDLPGEQGAAELRLPPLRLLQGRGRSPSRPSRPGSTTSTRRASAKNWATAVHGAATSTTAQS